MPLVRTVELRVPPASIGEHYGDWHRLTRELSRFNPADRFEAGLLILRGLAAALYD